jgi:dihydrofolate reductase
MPLSLIVAMSENGVIGRGGTLPWRLSADLKRFKSLTMGHHLIMGRKTYDSLGRVLPGRTSIVVTRQANWRPAPELLVAQSVDEAIRMAEHDSEAFVIGGGEIYAQALPRAERIYLTRVEREVEGDTRFPEWNPAEWQLTFSEPHSADAKNEYDYTFCVYDRNLGGRSSR